MKLLLDTHLLLWTVGPDERLSDAARRLIGDPENQPLFSVVSLWEVAIKYSRGRDDFQVNPQLLRRELFENGYQELLLSGSHAAAVADLPLLHRDPFDRMLLAQSIVEGITLLTTDPLVTQYPAPVQKV